MQIKNIIENLLEKIYIKKKKNTKVGSYTFLTVILNFITGNALSD
jgi:hypothetical protein